MFTPNRSVRNQGFSAMTTAVVAAVVTGIGAGAVYVSTQNKMTAEKTATPTTATTQERTINQQLRQTKQIRTA